MKSLFAPADANGAAPSAPAAPASATGWDGFGAKAKMGVGIAAVIGVVALVVLPGYGDKPAPQQIALQTPTPSSVTEYVPASAGLIERATTFVTPNLPDRGVHRYVPTDIGLYAGNRSHPPAVLRASHNCGTKCHVPALEEGVETAETPGDGFRAGWLVAA